MLGGNDGAADHRKGRETAGKEDMEEVSPPPWVSGPLWRKPGVGGVIVIFRRHGFI